MKYLKKIKHFFIALYHLFVAAGQGFAADRVMKLSASLAYYTIFALTPLIIIVIAAASIFFGDKINPGTELFSQISQMVGTDAADQLRGFVEHANLTGKSTIGLIIGVVTLVVASTAIFVEIQDSINIIWQVKAVPKKGWLKMLTNRLLSFSLIVSLGFLLLVSLVINTVVSSLGNHLETFIQQSNITNVIPIATGTMTILIYVLNTAFTLLAVTAVFTIIFKVLPDVDMKWKTPIIGAIFTAILFSLGQYLIGIYIQKLNPGGAYGAASSIIVILVWVYYTSVILYFGAEFTQAYAEKYEKGIRPSQYAVHVKTLVEEEKVSVLPKQHPENVEDDDDETD